MWTQNFWWQPLFHLNLLRNDPYSRLPLVAQLVKNLPVMQETWVRSLGWEDPLEKGKATYPSILSWRNSMDCIVYGVAKSRTWLGNFHFTTHILSKYQWKIYQAPFSKSTEKDEGGWGKLYKQIKCKETKCVCSQAGRNVEKHQWLHDISFTFPSLIQVAQI